jgi:hypothetical protein
VGAGVVRLGTTATAGGRQGTRVQSLELCAFWAKDAR